MFSETIAALRKYITGVGYDYNGATILTVCFTTNLKDLDKWLHISDNEILIDDAANNVLHSNSNIDCTLILIKHDSI